MPTRILFLSSNGVGLGHLTRGMAIARRLPAGTTPLFLTLSQALPVVRAQGFYAEFLFSAGSAGTDRRQWNALYRRRLAHVLALYRPAVAIYDGTYPYRGLLDTIEAHPQTPFVWSRRAMWRPGVGAANLAYASLFTTVVEPGEFAAAADAGLTVARRDRAHTLAPICYPDAADLVDRAQACAELALDPGRVNVLVQLGAGNINDISTPTGQVVERLRHHEAVTPVVAESTIAERRVDLPEGVQRVRTYPLARLYRAFDAAVAAAGYNTFHELIALGVPTLFVPNTDTAVDDQLARAAYAQRQGVARCWQPGADGLDEALAGVLDASQRARMRARCAELDPGNGAADAAALLMRLAGQAVPA